MAVNSCFDVDQGRADAKLRPPIAGQLLLAMLEQAFSKPGTASER